MDGKGRVAYNFFNWLLFFLLNLSLRDDLHLLDINSILLYSFFSSTLEWILDRCFDGLVCRKAEVRCFFDLSCSKIENRFLSTDLFENLLPFSLLRLLLLFFPFFIYFTYLFYGDFYLKYFISLAVFLALIVCKDWLLTLFLSLSFCLCFGLLWRISSMGWLAYEKSIDLYFLWCIFWG